LIAFFRAAMLGGLLPWESIGWSASSAALMFVVTFVSDTSKIHSLTSSSAP
jgi:hypothetical protein